MRSTIQLGLASLFGFAFFVGLNGYPVLTVSQAQPSKSENIHSMNLTSQLSKGTYYARGTFYNNSRREIFHNSQKTCIKIVDGPPSPYEGQEKIIISSLSVNNEEIHIDATGDKIKIYTNGNIKSAFSQSGARALWELQNKGADPRTTIAQDEKVQECLDSSAKYTEKINGISISGLALSTSDNSPQEVQKETQGFNLNQWKWYYWIAAPVVAIFAFYILRGVLGFAAIVATIGGVIVLIGHFAFGMFNLMLGIYMLLGGIVGLVLFQLLGGDLEPMSAELGAIAEDEKMRERMAAKAKDAKKR